MEAVANAVDEERLVADTVASARTTQAMSENLLSTPLFTALSQDTRAKLRTALHPRHYSAGMFVCRQGMRGNTLFIITSGEVEVRWTPSNAIPGGKSGTGGDDDIEDEDYATETVQRSKVHIDLTRCREMMARKAEIDRAQQHRPSQTSRAPWDKNATPAEPPADTPAEPSPWDSDSFLLDLSRFGVMGRNKMSCSQKLF